MTLRFLKLTTAERRVYFEQAALRRNVSAIILEKDFWVCWVLSILFKSQFAESLVFKGGTSLSKVFGLIDRFSEDIDLSISPQFLNLPEPGASRTQADKWMTSAETACGEAVRDILLPALELTAQDELGRAQGCWFEYTVEASSQSPVLLFHYPTTQSAGLSYLKRSVKLEFGALTNQRPIAVYPIRPWLFELIPKICGDWSCNVTALDVQRTFWEKATILHAEYYRPKEKPTPDRFSRHYADTAAILQHGDGRTALRDEALRRDVVAWKSRFFGSTWARYDLAMPGTFRLVPPKERLLALRGDYEAMRVMYVSHPRSFDEVLSILMDGEQSINS
jgi:hypothetical protein